MNLTMPALKPPLKTVRGKKIFATLKVNVKSSRHSERGRDEAAFLPVPSNYNLKLYV